MKNNPIVEANVWVVEKEGNENLNEENENIWRETTLDLTEVCAIECNGVSFDEDFIDENAAIVHFKNGRSFTIDRSFSEINELFKKVKAELYATS